MENPTEVEYISIYERPKRPLGRPCGSKYSEEEKAERKRQNAKRLYLENYEYRRLQQALYNNRVGLAKQK